jgi:hypothetical protein
MSYTGFKANNSNYPTETDLAQIFVHYTSPPPSNTPTGFVVNNGNYPSTTSPEAPAPSKSAIKAPAIAQPPVGRGEDHEGRQRGDGEHEGRERGDD